MARRNVFESVMREEAVSPDEQSRPVTPAFTKFGAAKSLSSSIDALARQANMLVEGQTIVELDPNLVDGSFVTDRMTAGEDSSFAELLSAIRDRGQDSPVLVRPHPERQGRYQVVFGHRRLRVAKELGRPLRAVIKTLADIEHVLAQGQENTARANLSFIEKVLFAQKLSEQNFAREVIQSALSVDYQTLSKMLTIPKVIAAEVIESIGPAPGVGRDRWLELRKLMESPEATSTARDLLGSEAFAAAESAARFDQLFNRLAAVAAKKVPKKPLALGAEQKWAPQDGLISGRIRKTAGAMTFVLKTKGKSAFGEYLARNLDQLYAAYQKEEQGD